MENLTLTHIFNPSVFRFFTPSLSNPRRPEILKFSPTSKKKFVVFASKGDPPSLNGWELMELKFGKMLGEDPKLTMAKIMGKRMNPDMTDLEIEKLFYNKKRKGVNTEIEELPFDVSDIRRSSSSPNGLNLVRPVPKKGVKFETKSKGVNTEIEELPFDVSDKRRSMSSSNGLNLVRPVPKKGVKFETKDKPKVLEVKRPGQPVTNAVEDTKSRVPNVILRKKPSIFTEDDEVDETKKSSRLRIKPNFSLKMSNEQTKERFSDLTMIRRPEPANLNLENKEALPSKEHFTSDIEENGSKMGLESTLSTNDVSLLGKPKMNFDLHDDHEEEGLRDSGSSSANDVTEEDLDRFLETIDLLEDQEQESESFSGMQPLDQSDGIADSNTRVTVDAALQGKPERLDQSAKETTKPKTGGEEMVIANPEIDDNSSEVEKFAGTYEIKEREDADWARAEDLVRTEEREEVELISSSTRGFVVSFGSLVGFLPYRYLPSKCKYLAFESWLRRNDLDPATYKQNLGVIGNYGSITSKSTSLESTVDQKLDDKLDLEISPDMKIEDLVKIYNQEKSQFLRSLVGQKMKANVVLADRTSRRLIFSRKPREKEEAIKRKRNLMAKLRVGEVVKCCIVKIIYLGVFVKVEGVPALIHQTEVSWDATLDPQSYFKIGQVVDAKVHQLDFSLERIYLSLKELTPDPLIESFESIFTDNGSLDGRLEEAQPATEWADVETLIKELEQFEGIESVSKGRYCLSPSLAPTFQVYMASMFENQYKLLARSENRVQEVIVQTSLSKEEMKSVIQTCTNRVA